MNSKYLLTMGWQIDKMTRTFLLILAILTSIAGIRISAPEISYAQQGAEADKPVETAVPEVEAEEELLDIKLAKPVTYSYVEEGDEKQKLDFYRYISSRPGLRPVLIWTTEGVG